MGLRGEPVPSSALSMLMVRLVSAQLGRPLGVDDLDIDVALPVAIDDAALSKVPKNQYESPEVGEEPHASTLSGFIALTKLCKIAGRVAVLLYRPSNGRSTSDPSWAASQQNTINKLDKTLKDWLEKDVVGASCNASVQTLTSAYQIQGSIIHGSIRAARLGCALQRILCRPLDPSPQFLAIKPGLSPTPPAFQLAVLVATG